MPVACVSRSPLARISLARGKVSVRRDANSLKAAALLGELSGIKSRFAPQAQLEIKEDVGVTRKVARPVVIAVLAHDRHSLLGRTVVEAHSMEECSEEWTLCELDELDATCLVEIDKESSQETLSVVATTTVGLAKDGPYLLARHAELCGPNAVVRHDIELTHATQITVVCCWKAYPWSLTFNRPPVSAITEYSLLRVAALAALPSPQPPECPKRTIPDLSHRPDPKNLTGARGARYGLRMATQTEIDALLSTLNAADVGTLDSVAAKIREVKEHLERLSEPDLAACADGVIGALGRGDLAEFKRGKAFLQSKIGHHRP